MFKRLIESLKFRTNLGHGSPVRELPRKLEGEPFRFPEGFGREDKPTLRSRVPVLISQILERKGTVAITPFVEGKGLVQVSMPDLFGHDVTMYSAPFDFEKGVHGANTIALERHLQIALENLIVEELNK